MTLPWMAAKILLRPVAELRPHAGNARVHSAGQLEQIKASMLAFGFTNPLLVDEDGVLIAGHGRLEAASALGMAKVPVIVLRHLSAAQKEALRLADNRIAENATWDQALLRDALAAVQAAQDIDIDLAALGFSADELADILAAAGDAVSDGDAPARGAVRLARRVRRRRRRIPRMPIRFRRARSSPALATFGCSASIACSAATAPTPPAWRASWARSAPRCCSPRRPTATSATTPPAAATIGMR